MEEQMKKYAEVLLKTCLKVEKNQPLFISANIARIDFVRIVSEIAYSLGVKDIYYDISDPYLKHNALKNLSVEELKETNLYDRSMWNTYAKKGAAFLMLASETPGLMKDIDPNKLNEITTYQQSTRKEFDDLRDKYLVPWCIAAVPTIEWAKEVFPTSKDPVKKLWQTIFKICAIDTENPEEFWDKEIARLSKRADNLNKYKIHKLKYTNSLGTNFEICLPKNVLWASGKETLATGKEVLVNFPTKEVFTSPDRLTANGIVYSSKPLCYQDNVIKDFAITFKDGQAIKAEAQEGEALLQELIKSTPNIERLGEVALVDYDSSISKSNITFYETLFDENASCHLALGASFPECIEGGPKMNEQELLANNLNQCLNHVDFMIGTKDTNITGITEDGQEIPIFINGNFSDLIDNV